MKWIVCTLILFSLMFMGCENSAQDVKTVNTPLSSENTHSTEPAPAPAVPIEIWVNIDGVYQIFVLDQEDNYTLDPTELKFRDKTSGDRFYFMNTTYYVKLGKNDWL